MCIWIVLIFFRLSPAPLSLKSGFVPAQNPHKWYLVLVVYSELFHNMWAPHASGTHMLWETRCMQWIQDIPSPTLNYHILNFLFNICPNPYIYHGLVHCEVQFNTISLQTFFTWHRKFLILFGACKSKSYATTASYVVLSKPN